MGTALHPAAVAATTDEARGSRSHADRLLLARPQITRRLSAAVFALPHSRLKRAIVGWGIRRAFEAWSRRDWELNTLLLDPVDYEFMIGDAHGQAPGMKERYPGIAGYLEAQEAVLEVFPDTAVETDGLGWAPDGRFVALLRFVGHAAGSGLAINQRVLIAVEDRRGLAVRHWYWWDVEAGARSVGIALPRR